MTSPKLERSFARAGRFPSRSSRSSEQSWRGLPSAVVLLALWLSLGSSINVCRGMAVDFKLVGSSNAAARKAQSGAQQTVSPPAVLTSGSQVERSPKGGETHRYTVPAIARQLISLHLEQDGVDSTLGLIDPSGKEEEHVESLTGSSGPVRLEAIAKVSGNYTATVQVNSVLRGGHYRLFVDLRLPTDIDSQRITAQRATTGAFDLFLKHDAKAASSFQSSAGLWRVAGDRYNEGTNLLMAGLTYAYSGDSENALKYDQLALDSFRAAGSARMEGYTLNNLSVVYSSLEDVQGALDKALDYGTRALELMNRAGDSKGQTLALMNLALAYGLSGQNDKASESLQRALPILREIGDRSKEANALNTLGGIYDSLAEPEKALESYRKGLTLGQELNDNLGQARALNNLGVVYSNLGDYPKALEYYGKAIPLFEEVAKKDPANTRNANNARSAEAAALENVGFIQLSLGNVKESLIYYRHALELQRASSSPVREASTLEDIGYANALLNNPGEASTYYTAALDLARKIGFRQREASVLNKLGFLYLSAGELDKAMQSFTDSLPIDREMGNKYKEAEALQGIATVKRAQGDLEGARREIEAAIAAIESLRSRVTSRLLQASYLANQEDAYEFYIDLLMQLDHLHPSSGYSALALQASERARARSLLDTLAEAHADIRSGIDPELLKEAQRLQVELNHKAQAESMPANTVREKEQRRLLQRQIEELLSEYDQVEAEMRSRNPHYADLVAPRSLGLKDIQKSVVDADSVLLEYSLGKNRSYLWAVTPDSFRSFELPAGREIEAEARNLNSLLTARNLEVKFETPEEKAARVAKADAEYWVEAARLGKEILGPAEAELGRKRLVVVAQGALQYISFAALPDPSKETSKEPLVISHEIVSLPSASVLAVLRGDISGRKPAPKEVAVLADPVFDKDDPRVLTAEKRHLAHEMLSQRGSAQRRPQDGDDAKRSMEPDPSSGDSGLEQTTISRLPHTRDEAQSILSLVPRRESLAALGFDANLKTATSTVLQQYRILHFATHGFIDSRHPQLSGIVLSLVNQRGEAVDGFLRLNEIYNLHLPADLVVLSGCETGLGEEMKGEGLIGLTRGFMYAGAARVVVSLWDISDLGTADFMKLFYEGMLRRGLSPSRALQEAQIEAYRSKQLSSPYYWAAFEIQGAWKPN